MEACLGRVCTVKPDTYPERFQPSYVMHHGPLPSHLMLDDNLPRYHAVSLVASQSWP